MKKIKEQKKLLDITVKISLAVQLIAGIISIFGIFIKLKKSDQILNRILIIDTVVQVVEFIFYIYLATFLYTLDNNVRFQNLNYINILLNYFNLSRIMNIGCNCTVKLFTNFR